jgi:hypothetical protein
MITPRPHRPPPPPASGWRRRYAWVLTLSWPDGAARTFRGSYTPVARDTRTSALTGIYEQAARSHEPDGPPPAVLFWSLDPEELT